MKSVVVVPGVSVLFDEEERAAAAVIAEGCRRGIEVVRTSWGLPELADCRVYVMTSWRRFVFQSAPWSWRPLMVASFPLWAPRVARLWRVAGGWAQRYGKRRAIGVKPPRLIDLAASGPGSRIFVPEEDTAEKTRQIACHELTHAFTAHLRLPNWLNEGLAMLAVDRMAGRATVRPETARTLGPDPGDDGPPADPDHALVHDYVRGYWLTRYFEERQPGLVRRLLSRARRPGELERLLAEAFGDDPARFWGEIDAVVARHYGS